MTKEEIFASLDSMLTNSKTKNFLNHLVRAYSPASNVDKVWVQPKGVFKCVLTKSPLISVQEIMEGMKTEQYKNDLMNSLKSIFDENSNIENLNIKLLDGKTLGLTGKDTTTFMSFNAYQCFVEWLMTKALHGDKHINWLLGSIRRNSLINSDEDIQKDMFSKMTKRKPTTSTYSLSDASDALAKLKAKMENKEK